MRWIPLLLIFSSSLLLGTYFFTTVKEFTDRRFYLVCLLYLTFLGIILFTPISFTGTEVYIMPAGIGSVNLHKLEIFELGFVENIILTIPLGFLIKKLFPSISIISMALLGFVIGGGIETTQYYLSHLYLINRSSDINDVIANGIGIVIGSILMVAYGYIFNRNRKLSKI